MSRQLIEDYYREVDKIRRYGGEKAQNEQSLRTAFYTLLNEYCNTKHLALISELPYKDKRITPDGTVKNSLRLDCGYWESKDEQDDIDQEIEKKLEKGYPTDNILFEDSKEAVLIQNGCEAMRVKFEDPEKLHEILIAFINYERQEVTEFIQAIEHFKVDLPIILKVLRETIDKQGKTNSEFLKARDKFLELCQNSINPKINLYDVQEMIIQHILTEDLFMSVFDETQFHKENTIARELFKIVETFFTKNVKRDTLDKIQHYYKTIKAHASQIADHHEKQKFLKVLYENFYKAYNPAKADRLGVIYTPNEIVQFMIEGTEWLLQKHFGRLLSDSNVEILDPVTGTGTFICEIIEHIPTNKLEYKYKNEIHCNELEILPYYIANLNIEYTYKQKTGKYEEFPNICFVDTLDNMGFSAQGKQNRLFAIGAENIVRIKRQNKKKISVVIGNPPYNANQQNENDNNKNREYDDVDRRIKVTYIKESTAQKTKVYDMYARFLRWSSDRLDENGVIAFVSNNSFINAKTYDGFRRIVTKEFNEIWIIDLKGDARTSGERRRKEGGNIFNDQIRVGVAVYFLIRNENSKGCKIYYNAIEDYKKAEDKKEYLVANKLEKLSFVHVIPDKKNNWLNVIENDFEKLLPLASKETKLATSPNQEKALFKLFSLGVVTARDEWVYDFNESKLINKVKYFCGIYEKEIDRWRKSYEKTEINDFVDRTIKWTSELEDYLMKGVKLVFNQKNIIDSLYRPFSKRKLYFDRIIVHRMYQNENIWGLKNRYGNKVICVNVGNKPFNVLATSVIPDYHFNGDSICFSLYSYGTDGNRIDNITDWGLRQFQDYYKDKQITKEAIFNYVYAVLHNPAYRIKYEINLKREFPRIPFYKDFWQWVEWGKELIDLHVNYETVKPRGLKRIDIKLDKPKDKIKSKLKAEKENKQIILDDQTTLTNVPKEAWEYKLGNRSALEWVLDQYKEKKPKDPTIREKFNTFHFADYKEHVIDLLQRVTTVSVETVKIIEEMRETNE